MFTRTQPIILLQIFCESLIYSKVIFKNIKIPDNISKRSPGMNGLTNASVFTARKEEERTQEVEKVEEHGTRVRRTFEWVHTQVGDYDVATSRIMKR